MKFRCLYLVLIVFTLFGCQSRQQLPSRITLGVVSFGEDEQLEEKYGELKTYLESELNSIVELEPAYNERQAVAQINDKGWDLVFASPGLAAIASQKSAYIPILPLEGGLNNRSIFVVAQESSFQNLSDLNGQSVALGQPGSATGYYFPLLNLYGLTLSNIRLAATPKQALQWLAQGEVVAAAMSLEQYNRYRATVPENKFRVLYQDDNSVPNGSVLVSNQLPQIEQEGLLRILTSAPPMISASVGYIANGEVPNYQELIGVIDKVTPITDNIQQQPAILYEEEVKN
ncbi:PhnD/SsuA/transferrin family substrate-binding protein [Crocosphaera sp.]|uniref:phosphate/phosphite/phosphonate ABC transporter substrate-binding protein n=1 Tax=Crocosphaera sp. TaxID=2729996 RepID=UPI00260CF852|nr:PhnD/SsuA/transferrin family substrate-binding protein [Crocosphaera sp.]MDJ0582476.1 PhnD/SsuA/transferrin family substrate-binding protein [Crocosphaera sp.]